MAKPVAQRSKLEKSTEQRVVDYALTQGVRSYKLNVLGRRNLPDRLFLVPGGVPLFMEFKRIGAKPRKGQEYEHKLLRQAGYEVCVVDSVAVGRDIIQRRTQRELFDGD